MSAGDGGRLWQRAQAAITGGVNSPARSFVPLGGDAPVFVRRAEGGRFWDEQGRCYVEYLAAFGPNVVGHGHPEVNRAIARQLEDGVLFGTPCRGEVELAEELIDAIDQIEQLRLVSSGTEAVMSAIRLARAATGRAIVVKFDGNYHGHADTVLVRAGSGASTAGSGDSAGVPGGVARDVRSLPYNDLEALRALFAREGDEVAAVLVEPISGNMGVVHPAPGYLAELSALARAHGALVIDDEIILGFRLRYGIVGPSLGLVPDIVCLGKVIGGGLALGAYGGRSELMRLITPLGPMFQAGTLAGNPLSVAAGRAVLRVLREEGVYEHLDAQGARLSQGLLQAAARTRVPVSLARAGSMFTLFFRPTPPTNHQQAMDHDRDGFRRLFWALLRRGVYIAPSAYEAWFVTLGHRDEDLDFTLEAAAQAFAELGAA